MLILYICKYKGLPQCEYRNIASNTSHSVQFSSVRSYFSSLKHSRVMAHSYNTYFNWDFYATLLIGLPFAIWHLIDLLRSHGFGLTTKLLPDIFQKIENEDEILDGVKYTMGNRKVPTRVIKEFSL